jgi:hypothetical protein
MLCLVFPQALSILELLVALITDKLLIVNLHVLLEEGGMSEFTLTLGTCYGLGRFLESL